MSIRITDAQKRAQTVFTQYRSSLIDVSGLIAIFIGAGLLDGWLPLVVGMVTAVVWWYTTTPLALAVLSSGLVAAIEPITPVVQSGASMGSLATLDTPIVFIAIGVGLLTVGSWPTLRPVLSMANLWTLLPLSVGWIVILTGVVADIPLWLVLAICGGLTVLAANAITQLTEYRLKNEQTDSYDI